VGAVVARDAGHLVGLESAGTEAVYAASIPPIVVLGSTRCANGIRSTCAAEDRECRLCGEACKHIDLILTKKNFLLRKISAKIYQLTVISVKKKKKSTRHHRTQQQGGR
jgi:hypothetical protein